VIRRPHEPRWLQGLFISLALTAIVAFHANSQTLPAFPGAEGFGAYASGGRYGDVYHVSNLSSSATTPGSFSYGLATAPATGRTIVFDVSGYIPVSGNLGLSQPNITIAGQTAPGDGVGLKGGTFWIEKTNVIVRHFRFRNGVSADCIDLSSAATNVILDHCDMLFSTDENFSSFGNPPENLTFQWSFNAWGLSPHSAGGLWYVKNATSHHSLWAHNHTRDPKALPTGLLDWVNNVTFDYGIGFIMADSTETADYKANVEGCYFICPPGNTRPYALSRAGVDSNGVPNFSLFLTNCLWDTDGDYLLDGYNPGYGMVSVHPTNFFKMPNAIPRNGGVPVTQDSPLVAYKKIVSQSGPIRFDANHPNGPRDEVASVLIASLLAQTHQRFTSVTNTGASNGGYGTLNSTPAPADTDRDGMPDFWETALGSNPALDDHTNQVPAGAFLPNNPAGYTLLEEYLHFRATPHAVLGRVFTDNPNWQDADLRRYTAGFTNRPPFTFTLANVSTGAVTLVSNYIARYVPPTNYLGRASFDFTITDADGSAWTQQFLLLIKTNPAARHLIWKGDGTTNAWDGNAPNFLFGTNLTAWRGEDRVTFDDTGSLSPYLKLSGALTPTSLSVSATQNYTFGSSGSLVGGMTLTKSGSGNLTISNVNTFTGGTLIDAGTITLAGSGRAGSGTVTLAGGTLTSVYGSTSDLVLADDVIVPAGETGTVNMSPRMAFTGASGAGTLNVRVTGSSFNYDRFNDEFAGFTGTLNITGSVATALLTLHFNGGNFDGNLANAAVTLDNVTVQGRQNSTGNTIQFGALSGTTTARLGGSGYAGNQTITIGALGLDTTFGGSISNGVAVTTLNKVGSGKLTLAGIGSHTGATTVNAGTLAVNGTIFASPITVLSNATLIGSGILGGSVTVLAGGKFAPGSSVGRMTVGNTLTLATDSVTIIELNKSTGTNDSVNVTGGTLNLGGTLVVTNLSGVLVEGDSFNLFSAPNTTGNFAAIAGTPGTNLVWSFNPTNGVLSVVSAIMPQLASHSCAITFPGYNRAEPLVDIPLLVELGSNISGFSYTQFAAPGGADLRFTTANDTNVLNHEVDTWNPDGDSRVWVQVPTLTSNTTLRAWWGNGAWTNPPASTTNGATWSAGYVGVWHLAGNTATDSTAAAHTATTTSSMPTNGVIGGGAFFSGSNAMVQVPWSPDFDLAGPFEVQGWFKVAAADKPAANNFLTLTSKEATASFTNRNWWISLRNDGRLWWKSSADLDTTNATDLADASWHHFAAVHDGTAARLYVDGLQAAIDATPGPADTQNEPVLFGNESGTTRYFKGFLDELRISNVSRSSNWVWAVYQNIASNSVFTDFGAVVSAPVSPPTFDSVAMIDGLPSFSIGGVPGYSYTVQASTNLAVWLDILTTNPPTMPFQWTDNSATNFNQRFYRVLISP
jgi:autotransporter-associated beta strand protein